MSGINYCLVCSINPNRVCQYCKAKYTAELDHFCEWGERHMFGKCDLCYCDKCEGRPTNDSPK